jgi:hypothetical protein
MWLLNKKGGAKSSDLQNNGPIHSSEVALKLRAALINPVTLARFKARGALES